MNHLKFTKDKLNVEDLNDLAASPKCGATSLFVGTTRDNFGDKTVLRLEYEAYETMGTKTMQKICDQIRKQWGQVENIVIYHRLGEVPIKEASIVIAISSPHRADAIKATEWCIDEIKKSVPIWKKEIYADEIQPEWKQNSECVPAKCAKLDFESKVEVPFVSPHLIQIKSSNEDLNRRIDKFMERKREEINANNVREFCTVDPSSEFTCARVDAILQKRKDSKGHLQVSRVLNTYHRDQTNSNYLTKYIPPNGVEERLNNLEMQLNLSTPVPTNIYVRLKKLEERLLHLEAISPEYIHFWEKTSLTSKPVKKKIFSVEEIDSFINDLEKNKS